MRARSFDDDDATRVFEALCRVERQGAVGQVAAPITRLLHELGEGPAPDAPGDEFPDFARSAPPPQPSVAAEVAVTSTATSDGLDPRDAIARGLLRTLASYQGLVDRYNSELDAALARRRAGDVEPVDETLQRLQHVQTILVKYPLAAQAAFRALVREGRRFADTDPGRQWRERLRDSALLARARTLFEGLAGGALSDGGGSVPSAYVDALVRALDRDLEGVLGDVAGVGRPR